MDRIDEFFNLMNDWRNLPTYQLERRADLFFALYLPRVLKEGGITKNLVKLIPEFPFWRDSRGAPSCVDYVALAPDEELNILIELKTDHNSVDLRQMDKLRWLRDRGFREMVDGVRRRFCKRDHTGKYYHLLEKLSDMGLVDIPSEVKKAMAQDDYKTAKKEAGKNGVLIRDKKELKVCKLIYIVPIREVADTVKADSVLSFKDFRKVLRTDSSPFSQRFQESLSLWEEKAGHLPARYAQRNSAAGCSIISSSW
jgi:hypothetical protein